MSLTEREVIDKMIKKPGLRGKINANCRWCTYDPEAPGSWRKQVQDCGVTDCPLYSVRPTSSYKEET